MIYPNRPLRVSDYTICVEAPPKGLWVLAHGYTGAIDRIDAEAYAWVRGGLKGAAPGAEIANRLVERGYVTRRTAEQEKALVASAIADHHRHAREGREAAVTLILSYDCNFRCTYCTQRSTQLKGEEHLTQGMSDEVMDSAFRFIETTGARDVTLFGGEPFMPGNEHRVRRLAAFMRKRGGKMDCISNGSHWRSYEDVLTPDLITQIQVTIDGPPESHDTRRVGLEKRETFWEILANVKWALERGLHISARINADRRNVEDLSKLTRIFAEHGLYDHHFSAYLAPVQGNGHMKLDPLFSFGEMYERMLDAHARECEHTEPGQVLFNQDFLPGLKRSIARSFDDGSPLPYKVSYCGAYTSLHVLDPAGRMYACWDFADDPDNVIGVFHPELRYESPALDRWRGRDQNVLLRACLSCPYVMLHGSGCQAESFRQTGSYVERDCQDYDRQFELAVLAACDAVDIRGRIPGTTPVRPRRSLPLAV